jgi:hypothetical protein
MSCETARVEKNGNIILCRHLEEIHPQISQFDWWRAKVCPLSLHTKGQWPTDNGLQNVYMTTLSWSFGEKRFVRNNNGNPNLS